MFCIPLFLFLRVVQVFWKNHLMLFGFLQLLYLQFQVLLKQLCYTHPENHLEI